MAFAASLNVKRGTAVVRTSTAGLATLDICTLPSRSAMRRCLKSSRGRPRRPAAMRARLCDFAPPVARALAGCARTASTTRLSCSICEILAIGFTRLLSRHAKTRLRLFLVQRAQICDAAELQLLYGSFAAAKRVRDFADALFLGEAHFDEAALLGGKSLHQTKQTRAVFNRCKLAGIRLS